MFADRIEIVRLPVLSDNYVWLIHDDAGHAVVVDPGEATVVEQALRARKLQLTAILLTHHHHDHIGGVAELLGSHPVPVYGPHDERISETTTTVRDGDVVSLAQPLLKFEVLAIPGHTLSHIAYVGSELLLCGDTMFSLGCGRLFEGSPAQMLASLDRLAALPPELMVCAAHEYTEANGRFAQRIDPHNSALQARVQDVATRRREQLPSLPVSLASELATNPFLRVDSDAVTAWYHANHHDADENRITRFAALRGAKDVFRG